jgi:hypothetical protein
MRDRSTFTAPKIAKTVGGRSTGSQLCSKPTRNHGPCPSRETTNSLAPLQSHLWTGTYISTQAPEWRLGSLSGPCLEEMLPYWIVSNCSAAPCSGERYIRTPVRVATEARLLEVSRDWNPNRFPLSVHAMSAGN